MIFQIGLSSEEAQKRLQEFGPNEITSSKINSNIEGLKEILLDPMGLMLLTLAAIYYLLGNTKDSITLFIAYIPVILVDVFMQLRSNQALKTLKASLRKTAQVYRDGQITEVLTKNLVPGDVILFEEGQLLPADGKVLQAQDLKMNESSLTGESIPVEKADELPFFGGTSIIQGRGLGLIQLTGRSTKFGTIASLLESSEKESSPLQKKVYAMLKKILIFSISLAFVLFFLELFRGKTFLQSLISALTFGMASIPEEFPVVFTLYLSFGAWRLSKHGVLVKSLPSVEALGSVDIICTDKTGTLTEGVFQLEQVILIEKSLSQQELWETALMACEEKIIDSMEKAIFTKAPQTYTQLPHWQLNWDYAFDNKQKYMSHVWKNSITQEFQVSMKGSVEGVLEHCATSSEQKKEIEQQVQYFAKQGKRLLALARKVGLSNGNRQQDEKDLSFIALLVFSDPVRQTSKEAIARCQDAGIQIKMLTGDHPVTAHAIAHETGILHQSEKIYTGDDLKKLTEQERSEIYKTQAIFSRVLPEQKHEMVQALKRQGFVVAMTGDGINDAPALKTADIGISMGENATDVARSAAQMILLKNNFNGIAEAVIEGRKIFSNLKKSFSYLISFHIPIILLALVPPLLNIGDFFLPIHIVLLELIVHPISAITFENLSKKTVKEKNIFTKKHFLQASISGLLLSFSTLILFYYFHKVQQSSIELARSIAFITILLGNIFIVAVEAYPERNKKIYITFLTLIALTFILAFENNVSNFFHLEILNFQQLMIALILGAFSSAPSFLIKLNFKN